MKLEQIVDQMVQNNIVQAEDKDIYTYGLEMLMAMLAHACATILIGLVFGEVWACMVFLLVYMPIRSYAGGLHASTHTRCFILSCFIIAAFSLMMRGIPTEAYLYIVAVLLPLASMIIFVLAPVEDLNKPLDELEVQVYREKTRKILLIEVVIAMGLILFGWYQSVVALTLSLTILAIVMIAGKVKLVLTKHR